MLTFKNEPRHELVRFRLGPIRIASRLDGAISREENNMARKNKAQQQAEIDAQQAMFEREDAERAKALKTFSVEQIPNEARPITIGTTSTTIVFDANIVEFKEQTRDKLTLSMNLGKDEPFSKALYSELFEILGENFTEMALKKIEKLQILKLLTDAIIH